MNNWVLFLGGLIYTIAILAFIYFYMMKRRHLLFRPLEDLVIEGEENVNIRWQLKQEDATVAEKAKYYELETDSVIVPHNGVWNVAFAFLIKSGNGLRYFDIFINDKLFNAFETPPSGYWSSFTGSFGLNLKGGDRIRFAARSPNGKLEISADRSYLALTQ